MRSRFEDNDSGPNLTEVVAEVSDALQGNMKRIGPLFGGLLIVATLARGLYKVEPGEQGVIRHFGRESGTTQPGLHFRWPLIQEVDVVNVEKVRRVEVGFKGDVSINEEALMLTGDENIVEVHMVVQYRVKDPTKFLFRLRNPERSLHVASEVALRTVVGRTQIDDVMTTGRAEVQAQTRDTLQRLMDDYQGGLEITEVKLDDVDAPDEVKDAFNAVTRAREDKEKLVNQARGYQEDKVPRARGEAQVLVRAAEGYKAERVLRSQGDADKFDAMLTQYQKAKAVTRRRLYLETLERVVAPLKNKMVIDESVANGALPVLPLRTRAAAAVGGVR